MQCSAATEPLLMFGIVGIVTLVPLAGALHDPAGADVVLLPLSHRVELDVELTAVPFNVRMPPKTAGGDTLSDASLARAAYAARVYLLPALLVPLLFPLPPGLTTPNMPSWQCVPAVQ